MARMTRRVLVTGGAGFIGSELVRQLVCEPVEVVVVDNLVNGRRENLEGVLGDQVRLVIGDVRDTDLMKRLVAGVDIVFHLACLGVRHSIHAPEENHEVNATATLRLLTTAKSAGVGRFVYVSSSEVYGTALWAPMTEQHPTIPMTVYGASKLAGECYTRAFHRTYGYPVVIVRPFNAYGPRSHHEGDSGEVIPKFLLRCMSGLPLIVFGDGSQTRDLSYVSDTARGILLAGFSDESVGETLNIGSGSELSIKELALQVMHTVGRADGGIVHDDPRPGDVLRLFSDTAKARRLLAFEPQVPLREGLNRLREWYLSLEQPPETLLKQEIVHNWVLKNDRV
jgi:UDP-glucose 4-epimerase